MVGFSAFTAAAATSKNSAYIAKTVTDAIASARDGPIQTSELLTQMQEEMSVRTLYAYGRVEHYMDIKFAPSPICAKLVEGSQNLLHCDSKSRVVYAPPSSGKTTAAKMFMKAFLSKMNCPAMMYTSTSSVGNYLTSIAECYPKYKEHPDDVLKCLLAALSRSKKSSQRSPWLILDEFNLEGEDGVNLVFAEHLFRQVHERQLKFNVLFITQNEEMSRKLVSMNSWQKIAPMPCFTVPDSKDILHAQDFPGENFTWKRLPWNRQQLSKVVFLHFPKLQKDEESLEQDENGVVVFKPLTGNENLTGALQVGSERMSVLDMKEAKEDDVPACLALATMTDYV